jgi:hypothetical protein
MPTIKDVNAALDRFADEVRAQGGTATVRHVKGLPGDPYPYIYAPGPGDLWGSPEDDAPRCHCAATCSAKGLTCLGNGCPWWEWDDFPPPFEPSEQ